MGSIFDTDVIKQMEQNSKHPPKPIEDTSVNQLPDDITDEEIAQLIAKMVLRR